MQSTKPGRKMIGLKGLVIMTLVALAVAYVLILLTKDDGQWNLNKTIGWGR